jgi:putative two-component system response regulator
MTRSIRYLARHDNRREASRSRLSTNRWAVDQPALLAAAAGMAEFAGDALVAVSPDGLITNWGEGARRLFGYDEQEVVGRSITILAPDGGPNNPPELIARVRLGLSVKRVEANRITKDGRTLRVLISLSAITSKTGEAQGVFGLYRDITQQREAEAAWRASEERYRTVVESFNEGVVMVDRDGRVLASNANAERLLELPVGALEGYLPTPADWSLRDEAGTELSPHQYPGVACLRTGEPEHGVILGVYVDGELRRWLSVDSSPVTSPDAEQPLAVVASFADITACRDAIADLQAGRLEDLERLAVVSEYRDDETFRHAMRVGCTAERIAVALGLHADTSWAIRRAAPLHDIGKIGIPDAILLKPAALTAEEFEVMKTHTSIGQRILGNSRAPVLCMAAEIAMNHHERWDGSGYPAGLRGDQIPVVGRIVAVADAFDAMTHDRPYKRAATVDDALTEITRLAGSQFDPDSVRALNRVGRSKLLDADQPEARSHLSPGARFRTRNGHASVEAADRVDGSAEPRDIHRSSPPELRIVGNIS